jgi:hypothetical protein
VHDTNTTTGVQKWSNQRYCVSCVPADTREQIRNQIETFIQDATLLEAVVDKLMTYDISSVPEIATNPDLVGAVARKCKAERSKNAYPPLGSDVTPYPRLPSSGYTPIPCTQLEANETAKAAKAARLETQRVAEAARLEAEKAGCSRSIVSSLALTAAAHLEVEEAEVARLDSEKAEASRLEDERAKAAEPASSGLIPFVVYDSDDEPILVLSEDEKSSYERVARQRWMFGRSLIRDEPGDIPDWSERSLHTASFADNADNAEDSATVRKVPRSDSEAESETTKEQEHVKTLLRLLEESQNAKQDAEEKLNRLKPELVKHSMQLMTDKGILQDNEKRFQKLTEHLRILERTIKEVRQEYSKFDKLVAEQQEQLKHEETLYQSNLAHEKGYMKIIEDCSAKIAIVTSDVNGIKEKHEGILDLIVNDSKKENDRNENICALCLSNSATCAFVPCGHRCICDDCNTDNLKLECIMCRAECQMIMRCY